MRGLFVLFLALSAGGACAADPPPVDTAALVAANSHPFKLGDDGEISGDGADFFLRAAANAQFVLFGETHHDYDTPRLARAMYQTLNRRYDFSTVVVEQDPQAVEAIAKPPLRGDVERIAGLSKQYPTHLGFSSDQDIEFLAAASRLGRVWGVEQAQGATRYLDELATLARDAALKARVTALRDEARGKEKRESPGAFLHDDATTLPRLEQLRTDFRAKPGSRAAVLLDGLVGSALIYSYNRRAGEGEYVGLYNNTEREALFKRNFVENYRNSQRGDKPLKAFFKFGSWHMYRGKSPGQAYTIGSFAHEFAIWNRSEAYGVLVLAYGGYTQWDETEAWLKPLLPAKLPEQPVLIDLRALKRFGRPFREPVTAADQWELRDALQGFDAIVILPASHKATWNFTGFPVP